MMHKTVLFAAACLALSVSALAQGSQPQCTLSVSPLAGPPPLTVTALANCTDPGNDIVSVSITWGDGSPPFTTTQTSFQTTHPYAASGSFTVTLTASDLLLLTSAPQTATVVVNAPPTCTLSVSPASGTAPLPVTATGSCSDPENDIVSEVLDWGDGSPPSAGTSGSHTYTKRGTFTVTLTATDSASLTGSATQPVSVSRNQTPACTLTVTPTSGPAPLPVSAAATCSDRDGDPLTTVLDWGDGSTTSSTTGAHTYTTAGSFTVTITATDPAGNIGTASQAVSVGTSTPSCALQVSPASGTAPLAVTVTANCSDAGNDLSSVVTDFGDGFYLVGSNLSHTYARAGKYTVTVVAHDKAGNASQPVSQTVTANDNPVLFVGVSNGEVTQFTKSGGSQSTLNSNQGGSITGMGFDPNENLYTTDFTADTVSKFNGNGALAGNFGSGYNCKPESIVFDSSGNAYVGETGCSHALLKFDAYGNLEAAYSVNTEQEGSDWIDLASDQCTLFYTSQGSSVLRYNACTKQQMPAFATGLGTALAVKVLPDGGALVAEKSDVVRFDSGGRKIMTYSASGESCFVSLALDSDQTTFWAADYCSSDVVRFDLGSGNEIFKFNSGTATNTVFGVAERLDSAQMSPAGPLTAAPAQASVAAGQSATFSLSFAANGAASGQSFALSCINLPANASCSFSPGTLSAGSSAVSAQLTIATAGGTARLLPGRNSSWMLALAFPGLGVIIAFAGGETDQRRRRCLILLLLLACLLPLLSCSGASGNSSSSPPPSSPTAPPTPGTTTPAGTYTVIVQASSKAGARSSTAVTLTVQ